MAHKLWDRNEEKEFIKQIGEGRSMADIAIKHGRTETAMELRLKKIIYDNVEKGFTSDKLSKIIKLPVDKINQYYYEYKGFIEKKDKNKVTKEQKLNEDAVFKENGIRNFDKISEKQDLKVSTMNIVGGNISDTNRNEVNNKMNDKIAILEKENKIIKEIVDNINMKHKINKLIDNGYLDKDIRSKIHRITRKK